MRTRVHVMRILVTNDDGVDAVGVQVLARALEAVGHEVTVGAPHRDFSGSGAGVGSIDHGSRVRWRHHDIDGFAGPVVSLEAPPALAVLAFCSRLFGPAPDLVVSGINEGYNTGRLVSSSSTVGAALTASALGLPSIAVSTAEAPDARFDTAAAAAVRVVDWVADVDLRNTCLNVNVPAVDIEALVGLTVAPLAERGLMGLGLELQADEVVMRRFANRRGIGEGTDAAEVLAGRVSVTPLVNVGTSAADLAGLVELFARQEVAPT